MPTRTNIEWADYSSNPLRARAADGKQGWACEKVSAGCLNCYAETLNLWLGTQRPFTPAGTREIEHYVSGKELGHILSFRPKPPYKNGRSRPLVFVCDMTDPFGPWVSDETLDRMFAAFVLRQDIDFAVLTKRPERAATYLTARETSWGPFSRKFGAERMDKTPCDKVYLIAREKQPDLPLIWPLPNVILGTSIENQVTADERLPWLLKCPAALRFVSAEPLLGPIDIQPWLPRIDWPIIGGESGPEARACDVAHVRSLLRQGQAAGVPMFVKQLGANIEIPNDSFSEWPHEGDRLLYDADGPGWHHQGELVRVRLHDRKGGDPAEWPEDLRVREVP